MVFVFIVLGIIIFICVCILLLLFSTLKVHVKNFEVNNILYPKLHYDYKFNIGIYFLGKVKILSINLNKNSKILKKVQLPPVKKNIEYNKFIIKELKKLHLQIEKLHLKLNLGTQDVLLTTFIVFIFSTAISIFLPHLVKPENYKEINYKILPLQNGKNCLDFQLNSIISVKMVHIINIIYIYLQRESRDKNGRTSNRRSYDNSHEQYTRYGRCKYNYRRAN